MDLKPFCGKDEDRPYLLKPFSKGEWTYAANGHIMVRVPRRDDVPEVAKSPNAAKVFADYPCETYGPLPVIDIPQPDSGDCEHCDGRGHIHDCPGCECDCRHCEGSGTELPGAMISVGLGGLIIAAKYYLMIRALPGAEIGAPPQKHEAPLPFRFDGGHGLVMPMRGKSPTHIEASPTDAATVAAE